MLLLIVVFKYQTIEVPEYYTTTYAALNCITKVPECYTMAPKYDYVRCPNLLNRDS